MKTSRTSKLICFVATDGWALLGVGQGRLPLLDQAVKHCKAKGRPVGKLEGELLTAQLDLSRLGQGWGLPGVFKGVANQWPRLDLTVGAKDHNVRTTLRLSYAEPLRLKFEPWRIPKETIRDPLISFTAVQPVASWLAGCDLAQTCGLQPLPNQLYLWAQSDPPMQTFAAMPVPDATNAMVRLGSHLPGQVNPRLSQCVLGQLVWEPNRKEILWSGLLGLVPILRPRVEASGQFLSGGIFPGFPSTNPPPAGLMAQFAGRTNLVCYDWEITQARLDQLRVIASLAEKSWRRGVEKNAQTLSPFDPRRPAQKFLASIVPHLSRRTEQGREGEAVTEITLTAPNELTLVRRSPIGLTARELVGLAWWLETPAFPCFPKP